MKPFRTKYSTCIIKSLLQCENYLSIQTENLVIYNSIEFCVFYKHIVNV